ncbi:MAG: bile acid:sodium symporter family protein [Aestuariivita sp.]|nr:bile acid:sodium symporter family protein [Aestuariivita sp.]MCY4202334.1 bile acid:sodium symporter family protein [Aestuariivita sp.]MCY4289943.1 bile acid:sodium symporter family protein [Aestuariivita sp.]MCY4346778.1 bile acid:sodium symporter family protein [Aestuariivita sp.]
MVTPFEQLLLAIMIFVIMLGMGASLTPRDFALALRRPYGLAIGFFSQYGFMPMIGVLLVTLLEPPAPIAIGTLIMACMPGGTTSNMFTYFSKGNLALSVLMTVNATALGIVVIPTLLIFYANTLELQIPTRNIIATLILLLVPVALGMFLRRTNANIGAVTEFFGAALGVFFIVFLIVTWVPRNWIFLMTTAPSTYSIAICLGLVGIIIGYLFAKLLRLHPHDARTIALETGIQNGPLALAIILFSFPASESPPITIIPALYSLFIVLISTAVTLLFRRANTARE